MKRGDFLEQWGLSSLKINLGFLEGEFAPQDLDRAAAWDLYIELLTRITTQPLAVEDGMKTPRSTACTTFFTLTREILRRHGSGRGEFAKLAVPVLNQIIRPFTAKRHKLSLAGAFGDAGQRRAFHDELSILQPKLRNYTRALADTANVEDLTELEQN